MKNILFSFLLVSGMFSFAFGQNASTDSKVTEIMAIINEHTPILEEFQIKLGEHKVHLEERIIVLKYHKGNKEVSEASRLVTKTIEDYYASVTEKVQQYESVWFDQTRNIIAIYTRYGELKEATGSGANELQDFTTKHGRYLDLLDNVKSDLIGLYTDLSFIKNNI